MCVFVLVRLRLLHVRMLYKCVRALTTSGKRGGKGTEKMP